MQMYKVTMTNCELVIEVNAPNAEAARGAVYNAFKSSRPYDALAGVSVAFDATEKQCTDARVMTTTVPGMRDVTAEVA